MTRHTDDTTSRRTDEENRRSGDAERETTPRTMADVSHTNPTTGESFGDSQVYKRGTIAVVDGGEADSRGDEPDEEPMKDVDHTPREGAPEANEAYVRGADREEGEDDADAPDADTPDADEEAV